MIKAQAQAKQAQAKKEVTSADPSEVKEAKDALKGKNLAQVAATASDVEVHPIGSASGLDATGSKKGGVPTWGYVAGAALVVGVAFGVWYYTAHRSK